MAFQMGADWVKKAVKEALEKMAEHGVTFTNEDLSFFKPDKKGTFTYEHTVFTASGGEFRKPVTPAERHSARRAAKEAELKAKGVKVTDVEDESCR